MGEENYGADKRLKAGTKSKIIRTAAYVKLAKLWERSRDEAIAHHNEFYRRAFEKEENMELVGVYIDITGEKHIYRRPQMVRLLRDCKNGKINCITSQTEAYLAPNAQEFFYLMHYV